MKSLLNALQDGRLLELPEADKEKSLVYLAHLIEAVPDLAAGVDVVGAMLDRERSACTGLGHGVACPHVRAPGGGELVSAVGWSPSGIDYGAPDGKKVHLVVMYYIPDSQKGVYLKEISGLAGAIQKAGGIGAISGAKDLSAVRERLLDWVSAAIEAGLPESKARMIRLEARQAAAEAAPAGAGAIKLVPVRLVLVEDKVIVLCGDPDLTAKIEAVPDLAKLAREGAQFDAGAAKLLFQSSTRYGATRALAEYFAL